MEEISEQRIGIPDSPRTGNRDENNLKLEQEIVKSLSGFSPATSLDNDIFHPKSQHNITASDNSSSSDKEDITFQNYANAEPNAHESGGGEDIREEEDTKSQITESIDSRSGGIAGNRRARTRWWPPQSDTYHIYSSLQQRRVELGEYVVTLGKGQDSGRNRLAIFRDADNTPRLAYNIRVEGRTGVQWTGYPSPKEYYLPAGVSLSEVLAQYPNHVWNDGLRLFMAEGWLAEKMWKILPRDARNEGASTRKWNYLQQALGREADKVGQEQFGQKRIPDKRLKKDEPDSHQDHNQDDENGIGNSSKTVDMSSVAAYTCGAGGLRTASQGLPFSHPYIMTSDSDVPGFYFSSLSLNVPVSARDRDRGRGRGVDQGQADR